MSLLQLISDSPFKALKMHMRLIDASMVHLKDLMHATYQQDWKKVSKCHRAINKKENEADAIKRTLRTQLHRNLMLPVSRHELMQIMNLQDDLANLAKDIAGLIDERQLVIPEPMPSLFENLMQDVDQCYLALSKTNGLLVRLVRQVFTASVAEEMDEYLNKLDAHEQASDHAQQQLRKALFSIESQHQPLDVICLYQLIQYIGMIADKCQKIGNQLLLMIAH